MIKVTITPNEQGFISEFTISGHAEFADPGEDLVCAGISAISFGMINAVYELLHVELTIEMEQKTGFLHCVVPEQENEQTHEKIQLLLEAMVVSLESVASEYGEYVTINKH